MGLTGDILLMRNLVKNNDKQIYYGFRYWFSLLLVAMEIKKIPKYIFRDIHNKLFLPGIKTVSRY